MLLVVMMIFAPQAPTIQAGAMLLLGVFQAVLTFTQVPAVRQQLFVLILTRKSVQLQLQLVEYRCQKTLLPEFWITLIIYLTYILKHNIPMLPSKTEDNISIRLTINRLQLAE